MSKQDKAHCNGGRVSNVGGVMKRTLQNQDEWTQGQIQLFKTCCLLVNGRGRSWAAHIFVLAQNWSPQNIKIFNKNRYLENVFKKLEFI